MYRLIKEYPGSPKLDTEIDWDYLNIGDNRTLFKGHWTYDVHKYPEFWENENNASECTDCNDTEEMECCTECYTKTAKADELVIGKERNEKVSLSKKDLNTIYNALMHYGNPAEEEKGSMYILKLLEKVEFSPIVGKEKIFNHLEWNNKSYRRLYMIFKEELLKLMKTCYLNQKVKDDEVEMNKRLNTMTISLAGDESLKQPIVDEEEKVEPREVYYVGKTTVVNIPKCPKCHSIVDEPKDHEFKTIATYSCPKCNYIE